jgi:high-affinity nickel permease
MNASPLFIGGLGTGLLAGVLFGARHALEPDHVAAVATLVEDGERPGITGAVWGTGHSVPILLLGGLFLMLDVRIPTAVAAAFELLVAVILVGLGVRTLAGREAFGLTMLRHVHQRGDTVGGRRHRHINVAGRHIGLLHSHRDEESLAVGVVHGLAGSGGVVIALAAAARTAAEGTAFLLGFSLASVLAMGVAAWAWGQAIGQSHSLRLVAGVASVLVGLLLLTEVIGLALPG